MHYMPDTEEADSLAETFWPEDYKSALRENLGRITLTILERERWVRHVFNHSYHQQYSIDSFRNKLNDMLVISAENGADDAFDSIVDAFLTESRLPEVRRLANYLCPQAFPPEIVQHIKKSITSEYREDNIYNYAYEVGYRDAYSSFNEFLNQVSELVITGAMSYMDHMLSALYQSFMNRYPLPQARRYPRRLKVW